MEKIEIERKNVVLAYNSANDNNLKGVLKTLFGNAVFDQVYKDVRDRVKSYEDACKEIGINPIENWGDLEPDEIAYKKLRTIAMALNEGWVPQFIKGEYRWYTWFSFYTKAEINDMEEEDKSELWLFGGHAIHGSICGLSASSAVYDFSLPSAYFGARLVLKSKDLALYMGKQFIDIWKDYVFIDGSNGNK
jgi:hypothetical protein